MKLARVLVPSLLACCALACRAAEPAASEAPSGVPKQMARYWFGLIRRGPNATGEVTPEVQELQRAHLANIGRLAAEGKLVLAGPFEGSGDLRGIFIYDVATEEEARALADSDPAVAAGRLEVELLPWWGTAELRELSGE